MPINPDLLIAAPMLQDSFIDKDGRPMAYGIITCYQDNSRTTLKNWYYQSGTPGTYTYIKFPNPLTLSAAGTISDINGVDTIPFFYPYSESNQETVQPYYITIVSARLTNQITRANFPFLPSTGSIPGMGSNDNYIINNGFWRNITSSNLTNVLSSVVAPSQHDGFRFPDIYFIKNITGGADTVTFTSFPLTTTPILTNDITPEFYINHTCSNTPLGETQKCYQIPISLHVNTLASVPFTVTIQAQNAGGTSSGQNVIGLYIFQDTGTGTSSPDPFLIRNITLTSAWTKYEFDNIFPPTSGLTLGNGADDALYLQIQMPLNIACSINFTKPSIYLSATAPTNNFQTYDQVDSIINSPRTGDIRTSINTFYPYGWVPMNDGTIGYNPDMSAIYLPTAFNSNQTWPLYNLIWSLFKAYTGISFNPICPMINATGSSIPYGASAISDFNATRSLTLTKMMGRVMLGTVPADALILAYATVYTASNSGGNLLLTTANSMSIWNGMPFYILNSGGTFPGNLGANTIYYVSGFNGTTSFFVSTTFAGALIGNVLAFSSAGTGTQTIHSALEGTIEGEYSHQQILTELVGHTHPATSGDFVITVGSTVNYDAGAGNLGQSPLTGAVGGNIPFNITQPGTFYNMFMKL